MKTFDYIKNIIKVIIWPIIFGIGQFFVILVFTFSFNNSIYNNLVENNSNLNTEEINEMFNLYISSEEYKLNLTNYINDNTIWIVLIVASIFIPLLILKYKKIKPKFNIKPNINIAYIIIVGMLLSLSLNSLIINLNKILNIQNNMLDNKYLITMIISSVIIGPIIEELMFRGIIFNKIKTFNKIDVSIILTTLIFAFFHDTLFQMLYAFIIGYICIKLYLNYNSLLYPIIFHASCNIIAPLYNEILVNLNITYTVLVIIITSIISKFFYKKMYKKN